MYKTPKHTKTQFSINNSTEGETIEQKIERIVNNKEPIKDGAPLVYTERNKGILPEYNIRTDRFEIAIDAMDKVSKSIQARRENRQKEQENNGKTESTQGTDN